MSFVDFNKRIIRSKSCTFFNKLFQFPLVFTFFIKYKPKCWATSNTSLGCLSLTSKALRIWGKASSNCTSTTAPMTATTRPGGADEAAASAVAAY